MGGSFLTYFVMIACCKNNKFPKVKPSRSLRPGRFFQIKLSNQHNADFFADTH